MLMSGYITSQHTLYRSKFIAASRGLAARARLSCVGLLFRPTYLLSFKNVYLRDERWPQASQSRNYEHVLLCIFLLLGLQVVPWYTRQSTVHCSKQATRRKNRPASLCPSLNVFYH